MDGVKSSADDLPLAPMIPVDVFPSTSAVMDWGRGIGSWFWHPGFWLPSGYTWEDIAPTADKTYPNFHDVLSYPLFIGFSIYCLRFFVLNPFVFGPLADWAGLKYRIRKPPARNAKLEKLFDHSRKGKLDPEVISSAAESLHWTSREVERWLRQRKASAKLNKLQKFQECAFVASYHIIISFLGVYILYDKPWIRDISHTWIGFPKHEVSLGEWLYYMISIGFYWAFCFSHLKSSLTDYIHHACTILLLCFSWACNLVRVGCLILLVHECGDIILHIAKMFLYLKKYRTTEILLAIFFVVWVSTRLGLFPFWILRNMYFEAPRYDFMPAGYVFYALLFGLLVLNVFWTCLIIVIIMKSMMNGAVVTDIRSSESSSFSNDEKKAK